MPGGIPAALSQLRFIAHGVLIPLLFPVCGYALGLGKKAMKALWIVTAAVMALGLAEGIRKGKDAVVREMRLAARSAVNTAKAELKISSPSRVFRDEIGAMTMKGLGEGITRETKKQASVIANAARYLTDEARGVSVGYPTQTNNSRTYNSNSSVNFSGSSFYIRDQQDVHSLAVEIASLTKRQQRGKGLRMA